MGVPAAVGAAAWLPEIAGRAEERKNEEGGGRREAFRVRGRRELIFIDKEGGRACLVREK